MLSPQQRSGLRYGHCGKLYSLLEWSLGRLKGRLFALLLSLYIHRVLSMWCRVQLRLLLMVYAVELLKTSCAEMALSPQMLHLQVL